MTEKIQLSSLDHILHDEEHELERDGEFSITHYATSPIEGTLSFAENVNFANKANRNDNVTGVITTPQLKGKIGGHKGLIVSEYPKKIFFEIHNWLAEKYSFKNKKIQIAETADVHPTAILKGGVIIGERTKIGAYSVIEEGTVIGKDVLIESHVVIGARGMHNTKIEGHFVQVKDLGNVVIGDRCEILSHAIIQRPYFYHSTTIGQESRISVACDIGHGCNIGERCLIAGHSVIAGYCTIGNDVWIGPNSTISHMTKIGNDARVLLGGVVIEDVAKSTTVSGNFAYNHVKNFRLYTKNKN